MSRNKADQEREKIIQERCQMLLNKLLKEEDNKYCVDCDAKGPRWASWNIGVFLCIRCAGIHRNLGVHISKVRSVNLDSWTPAQVSSMQCMGNSRGRAVYEAGVPDHFKRPTSDSGLEQFIRAKYEKKKYIMKDWVATKPPDLPEGWQTLIEQEKVAKSRDGKPQMNLSPSNTTPTSAKQQVNLITSTSSGRINSSSKASVALTQNTTSTSSKVTSSVVASSSSVDLLGGLITSSTSSQNIDDDDMFSNFVSAPAPTLISSSVTPSASTNSLTNTSTPASNLEEDFFNQVSVSSSSGVGSNGGPGETSKMSNSSIMALFSSVPQSKGPTMIASPAAPQALAAGYNHQGAATHQQLPQSLYPSHQLQALGQQQHFTGQQSALFNNNKPATGQLAGLNNQINQSTPGNQISQNIFQMNNQFSDLTMQSSWGAQTKNQVTPASIQGLYDSGMSGGGLLTTPSTNMFTSTPANMFNSPVSAPAPPQNLFNSGAAAAANGQTSNNLANSLWN